jgi:WD40 repeat protein
LPHPAWVLSVQFSPDGTQLLTGCTDGMARLWDWQKGRLVCPGFDHGDEVHNARFVPHQPWILTLGHDAIVRGWEPLTGKAIMPPLRLWPRLSSHVDDLMISGDGRLFAVPGTKTFLVGDVADCGILGRQQIDLADMLSLAELYAGRRIVASGTVKLTADEWLDRWKSVPASK